MACPLDKEGHIKGFFKNPKHTLSVNPIVLGTVSQDCQSHSVCVFLFEICKFLVNVFFYFFYFLLVCSVVKFVGAVLFFVTLYLYTNPK